MPCMHYGTAISSLRPLAPVPCVALPPTRRERAMPALSVYRIPSFCISLAPGYLPRK